MTTWSSRARTALLQLDGAAGLLDLALEALALLAVHALADRLGRPVPQRLGLLEAEARGGAGDLVHPGLLFAPTGQHDVDRGRLLLRGSAVAGGSGGRSRGGDRRGGYA